MSLEVSDYGIVQPGSVWRFILEDIVMDVSIKCRKYKSVRFGFDMGGTVACPAYITP